MKGFNNYTQLVAELNESCERAIEETAKIAGEKLTECINNQYYKDPGFYPNSYTRTEEFLNSVLHEMVNNMYAEIYIDIEGMHYKNDFDPWQVVSWASESQHGADYYQTETEDFWTVFINWCDNNLLNTLREKLIQYGVPLL